MKLVAGQTTPTPDEVRVSARTRETYARERLRYDILTGQLSPGSKLRVKYLCERYDVGATPLREALSRLVSEGLVIARENKGFAVAPLSIAELRDITELRRILEGQAFVLALEKGDDRWESEVLASFHRLKHTITAPVPDALEQRLEFERRHEGFHITLISACENRKLLRYAESLYVLLRRYRPVLQMAEMTERELVGIHERLVHTALNREREAAVNLIAEHVAVNVETVLESARRHPKLFVSLGLGPLDLGCEAGAAS